MTKIAGVRASPRNLKTQLTTGTAYSNSNVSSNNGSNVSGIATSGATTPAGNNVASGAVAVPTAGSIDDVSPMATAVAPSVPDMSISASTASLDGEGFGMQVRSPNLAIQQTLLTKDSVAEQFRSYAS